ncbi:MAG TPA: hypothetical protein VMX33_10040 [bacterium]|nr:hypothetical protein [bacterium]
MMGLRRRLEPGALILAVAIALCMPLILASCGAAADLAIRADRSTLLSIRVDMPAAVEARIRQFAAAGSAATGSAATGSAAPAGPLFNAEAVSATLRARGIIVDESATSGPRSYRGVFRVADLDSLLASDRKLAEALEYRHGPGWASLRLSMHRGNAAAVIHLFPGMDPDLLEALQPPALYDNPVTVAEYRSMLAGLLGTAAVQAIDGLNIAMVVRSPGPIMESSGVTASRSDRTLAEFSVRAIDALVLDNPVEFFIKWQEP